MTLIIHTHDVQGKPAMVQETPALSQALVSGEKPPERRDDFNFTAVSTVLQQPIQCVGEGGAGVVWIGPRCVVMTEIRVCNRITTSSGAPSQPSTQVLSQRAHGPQNDQPPTAA